MLQQDSVQNERSIEKENAALRNENAFLKEQLALVQEQMEWLKKQVFGRKTEQTAVIMNNGIQLTMFPEKNEQAVCASKKPIIIPEHQRKTKRTHEEWMSKLPIEEIKHEEEHPVCEKCGSGMKEIGEEKLYDELVYVPAKYYIRRHIAKKYKCEKCGQNPEISTEPCEIRRAAYPKPMIPHSFCSPELMAHIIYEKYAKAVPLHRQEKDLKSKGIPLLKATMSNWVCDAAENWCMPILKKMKEELLSGKVIHADETVLQVLHEEGRKATTDSRMWVYCNGKMSAHSNIIFDYKPTRKGENAQKFLQGFHGYLVRDGYSGYHILQDVKHCGCMTHARRYFVNAMPKDAEQQKTSAAAKAVRYFNQIYHEEGLLKEMTAEERYQERLAKVKPLLDEFFAWLKSLQVSGKSKLADAIRYTQNEKKYLYTFLEDGDVPMDNNRVENAIRPFAVGRKNWLFSNTARGAKCSAVLYSVLATAQANGMDAENYLIELFSKPMGTIILPWKV